MPLRLKSGVKQFVFVTAAISWFIFSQLFSGAWDPPVQVNAFAEYGSFITLVLIAFRLLNFLTVPQFIFNIVGLFWYNAFPQRVKLRSTPLLAPSICVRVVTRGLYPKLVRETVRKNMATLGKVGFENYFIQVVTDTSIGVGGGADYQRVQEVVVPTTYRTKTGALNKSRALQYCLEDEVNILDDEDWIVHLDEETLLTEDSVRGILNFVCDGKHDFGQGLITYASHNLKFRSTWKWFQHRICTVADSFRVADDMGKIRCQFKLFHKPWFGWKGSYVVTRVGAERRVSFDNGPAGSKAEDCFFGMLAMDAGYKFDFIEGEMHEKSPFTFSDFFKQRKRWMQGICMVVTSPAISVKSKCLLTCSLVAWLTLPLMPINLLLLQWFPFSLDPTVDRLMGALGAVGMLMYGYGYIKQFPVSRYSWPRLFLVVPEILISSLLSVVVEITAVCTMWFGDWYDFYIVEKELDDDIDVPEEEVVHMV